MGECYLVQIINFDGKPSIRFCKWKSVLIKRLSWSQELRGE